MPSAGPRACPADGPRVTSVAWGYPPRTSGAPPATCREEATEVVPPAPRRTQITEIRRCRLTLPYTSLPFIPANQPGRRRAVRTATPRQLVLPSARTSDRSGEGHV